MNTEEDNENLYKELLEVTKSLTGLYDKQVEEKKIEQFREDNPTFKDSPDEWVKPFLKD